MKVTKHTGRSYSSLLFVGVALFTQHTQAQDHAAAAAAPAAATPAVRETVRRTPAQVANAGVTSMYKLPKFEGLGFSLGREGVFRNNVNMMKDMSYSSSGQTGDALLASMKKYTLNKGCIPNLLIAGHGWGARDGKRETIATGSTSRDNNKGFSLKGAGATILGDLSSKRNLQGLVNSGEVKFCKSCQIFLHACSISHEYSEALAKTSGCSVVSATYKVSPIDTDTGVYDHVWFTSAGGKFHKYTPNAETGEVARRVIGEEFIFDPR